jgi:hypothetical protein
MNHIGTYFFQQNFAPSGQPRKHQERGSFVALKPTAETSLYFPNGDLPAGLMEGPGDTPGEMGSVLNIFTPEWQPQACSSFVGCVTPELATLMVPAVSCPSSSLPNPYRSLRDRLLLAPEPEDSGGEEHPESHLGPDPDFL